MLAIGTPAPHLAISMIADVDPGTSQQLQQPCLPQRPRRLLLAGSKGPRAGRHPDHTQRTAQNSVLI